MKKIAILVSGEGAAAERLVKLFNEGNRLHTVLVVTDETSEALASRLAEEEVEILNIPDSEWIVKGEELAGTIREKEIDLLVLDNFEKVLPAELLEATDGEMLKVTSAALAPREVVDALEAELRKPLIEEPTEEVKDENPSPESEWAESLKIQFTPPKVPVTPPEVPPVEAKESPAPPSQEGYFGSYPRRDYQPYHRDERRENTEPMPSTWLIWSILVTVFCCFIPGIVAIIFSSQVSTRYFAGDIEGSRRSSRFAEIWIIVSFVLGVISATLYLPFMLIGG